MRRRRFLQHAMLGPASAAAASALSKSLSAGESPPSSRIRVSFVGAGGRARSLLEYFSDQSDVEIVAIAEIDQRRVPDALKLVHERQSKTPTVHKDFRDLLDDQSVDAIVVGTPDHWHAIPTILACQANKDVYVEKPDGHNIVEGMRMRDAAVKHQRIVQLGTQARSDPGFQAAIDYIRSGKLGRVLMAKSWESMRQGSIGHPADSDPPAEVDYDTWLGPAPRRPFNRRRFHGSWRWFFDYGTGDLGNDGVHRIDLARWGLEAAVAAQGEAPLGLPTKITASGGKWYFDDMQEWPDTLQVNYESTRPDGTGLVQTYEMRVWAPYHYMKTYEGAALFGDEGYIVLGHGNWRAFGEKNRQVAEGPSSNDTAPHVRNFLDCVKSRQPTNADIVTVGYPSSLLCHTGNVAWRVGRSVILDPETGTFVGDERANELRTRPEYRAPWLLPTV